MRIVRIVLCVLMVSFAASVAAQPVRSRPVPSDLNGDGKSDIVWRNVATGQVYRMLMDGKTITTQGYVYVEPNLDWSIVVIANFEPGGTAHATSDFLWHNASTGVLYGTWFGDDGFISPYCTLQGLEPGAPVLCSQGAQIGSSDPALKIVGSANFNIRDYFDDHVFVTWNPVTGAVMGDPPVYQEPNTHWKIVTVADGDTNHHPQLLWHNDATGEVYLMNLYFMANIGYLHDGAMIYVEPNQDWQIVGMGDFDGDGTMDILWRNATNGQVYMMLMNGMTIASQGYVYQEPNTAWKIVALGDYDGDGKTDLLWRNSDTGAVYMMLMDGMTIRDQGMIYQEPNPDWHIIGKDPALY
jgi:hypothetical protein